MTETTNKSVARTLATFKIAGGAVLELWETGAKGSKCVFLVHSRKHRSLTKRSFRLCVVSSATWSGVFDQFEQQDDGGDLSYWTGSATWGRLYGVPPAFMTALLQHATRERAHA